MRCLNSREAKSARAGEGRRGRERKRVSGIRGSAEMRQSTTYIRRFVLDHKRDGTCAEVVMHPVWIEVGSSQSLGPHLGASCSLGLLFGTL